MQINYRFLLLLKFYHDQNVELFHSLKIYVSVCRKVISVLLGLNLYSCCVLRKRFEDVDVGQRTRGLCVSTIHQINKMGFH